MLFSDHQKILKTAREAEWRGWNKSYMNCEENFDSGPDNLRTMHCILSLRHKYLVMLNWERNGDLRIASMVEPFCTTSLGST